MKKYVSIVNHFKDLDKEILSNKGIYTPGLDNGDLFVIDNKDIDHFAFKMIQYNKESDLLDTTIYTKYGNVIHGVTIIDPKTLKNKIIVRLHKLYIKNRYKLKK